MISFQDVHLKFNAHTPLEVHALRGISLGVKAGEFVTLIGSNGAGKSTLLNALTGTLPICGGRIAIDGVDITAWSPAQRATAVARVFQDPMVGTCADLSIEENMALAWRRGQRRTFAPALSRILRAQLRDEVAQLNMGLEDRMRDPIGLLSGGQRQILSLLMAVLSPMKVLVLDEHTAALDPQTAEFVMDLTQRIVQERDLTVMMVTHSLHQALHAGTRTMMLHRGSVVLDLDEQIRRDMTIPGLLDLFKDKSGAAADDDALLFS